jgi:hypothetical protein
VLNGPGNPNLKLLCRQSVWLKSYGHFCALWEKKLSPSFLKFLDSSHRSAHFSKKNFGLWTLPPPPKFPYSRYL